MGGWRPRVIGFGEDVASAAFPIPPAQCRGQARNRRLRLRPGPPANPFYSLILAVEYQCAASESTR